MAFDFSENPEIIDINLPRSMPFDELNSYAYGYFSTISISADRIPVVFPEPLGPIT